jgi:hypothetical protein
MENDRYPRGNPNGSFRERADNISCKGHKERIRREQDLLDKLSGRFEKIELDK